MLTRIANFLSKFGSRIQNYGYLLANPSYTHVRDGQGCAELYRLLNKAWFPKNKIRSVLDVGANKGQFIQTSLALLPDTPIYAFEPIPEVAQKLKERYSTIEHINIFQVALGVQREALLLHISQFLPASSLLKPQKQLLSEFPEVKIRDSVEVVVERLDTLIQAIPNINLPALLKIDVQGFEMEVLAGATAVLHQVSVIVCEVNLANLYEKQCAIDEIIQFLKIYHFQLVDIGNPIRSQLNQEILYIDLAFKNLNIS